MPILATKIERHSTFAEKEVSMMAKMCFFQVRGIAAPLSSDGACSAHTFLIWQVFNTVVSSLAFLANPNIRNFRRPWYATGGALIANIMFGDAVFIQTLLDWSGLINGAVFNRHCRAPRAKTQLQMDSLYMPAADIYLAFRCQATDHPTQQAFALCPAVGFAPHWLTG